MRPNFADYDTAELWRKDRDHYIHPWTDFAVFHEQGSDVMVHAEGVYVFDSDGGRYLDGIGGLWCVNIGYGSDEMADAIAGQIMRIPYYSTFTHLTTPPAAELAAKLAELAPGTLNHVFYGTGGSMANDTAVRIIHFYFNRLGKESKKHIIGRIDGYHGSTYLAASLTCVEFDRVGFDCIRDMIHHISAPNMYRRPDGMSEEEYCDALVQELEDKIVEIGAENVAAFIAEPIMGAGGVLVPPAGYHRRVIEVCHKYEVFYISDEVVTGFGRLGHFFASEPVFDIVPDIITCAKGLTSGYLPLSGTLLSDQIYDVIKVPQAEGALFTHGFTYSGHPVCCAAGLKNIEIMERDDICGHARQVGPYFKSQLETLMDLPIVGDVRGSHFMMCIENVADKESKEILAPEIQIGNRIAKHCQARGLIVRPIAHLNVLSPPLVLTPQQIDTMVAILREGIEAAVDDLTREGLWRG
ncbi:MAG: aminotransferase [Alphaproteobacteria bacterium]|nr:aminotransferase [Alphaproteobacteria bacterium]